jgi:hypothetical protein
LAGGAVALAASKKKKKKRKRGHWGIRISKDCQMVEVTNHLLFRDFLLGGYKELIEIDPDLDIFQVTDAMFGEVAPNCAPFPEEPESAGISELYNIIVKSVTGFMVADQNPKILNMIDNPRAKEFVAWYAYWRNPPNSELPEIPASEVGFASDFSQYRVGKQWYAETVRPFVMALVQAGNAKNVYEEFIENRAVSVGRMILPISELPDVPMVVQFLEQVRAAIEQAAAEV